MHGDDGQQQGVGGTALRGAVGTVLKASAGAALAVLGAYVYSRARRGRNLAERIEKLEAMVKGLERSRPDA